MPQTRTLAWAQLRVGIMALASITIFVVLVFLMTGRGGLFRKTAEIRSYVDDSASLKEGVVVRLNGVEIGNVKSVGLSGQADPRRTIEIKMEVRRDRLSQIPEDSQSAIRPEGVFGDKYVNITRGKSSKPVAEGGEIRALDTVDFPEIVDQSYQVLASLRGITQRIDNITAQVEKGRGTIGKLLYEDTLYNRIDGVVIRAQNVVDSVTTGKGTLARLINDDQLYTQAAMTMQRADQLMANVQNGSGTLSLLLNDPALYENTNGVLMQARQLVDNANAGQGTLGKFLRDEGVYNQLRGILGKVDGTVERLNSGQGTLGQLLVNRALFDSFTGTAAETRSLIRDIRGDPRKFLRIKLALF